MAGELIHLVLRDKGLDGPETVFASVDEEARDFVLGLLREGDPGAIYDPDLIVLEDRAVANIILNTTAEVRDGEGV